MALPGEAVLEITKTSNDVQISTYRSSAFRLTNTGDIKITSVTLDVTGALYPDSVFDPFGLAGDTVSKPLTIDSHGNTGVVAPTASSYVGAGGIQGYETIVLTFNGSANGGFQPGESVGFSVDIDPNSIAGASKSLLDGGSIPAWDVGGVSGAELIGSRVTVTFEDGTTATGQLHGVGNQAGSQALASQDTPRFGRKPHGEWPRRGRRRHLWPGRPTVTVNGPAGETARIVLTKGLIQPVNNNFAEPTNRSSPHSSQPSPPKSFPPITQSSSRPWTWS